jgi:hypothetical protein
MKKLIMIIPFFRFIYNFHKNFFDYIKKENNINNISIESKETKYLNNT